MRVRLRLSSEREWKESIWAIVAFTIVAVGLGVADVCATISHPPITHAQTINYWFQTTNGDTTCRMYTVQVSPFRFSYLCENARGATAGSYTAVGATTTDVFTLGLAGATPGASQSVCMVAINTTGVAVPIGSFGNVPAQSASFQCGASVTGTVPI